ncbi:amyloid beta A4 precursor protein-binding family B member 1-interacting protein isoform X1 [Dendropsophus ebraccatus]|uniref:amyloid beta A4 precursor protein-binding family B member 1-interacting protein isoform X1 n=2 Tax=Dendropsophus ebraccatus TaxID=150705 RepID=UPI00383171C8
MEQTCDEIDEMFSNLLGEMDLLTQSLGIENDPIMKAISTDTEMNFSFGFKDLNESLNALEDNDLDALMADLVADCKDAELRVTGQSYNNVPPFPNEDFINNYSHNVATGFMDDLPPPPPSAWETDLPPPPPDPEERKTEDAESKAKADKIQLALGKMKEAKVKKLIVKVHMTDNSTKTLMVDERQTVREILDNLFEKTHCDCTVEWSLYEENPELQIERFFEDHENIVEILSDWTRDSENKIYFVKKAEKYAVFKNPQNFYMARKGSADVKDMNEKNKVALLEQSFCGASVVVPDLEGAFYLKEDGKKSWKKRYFLLRASGIYYVPKGKTKTSRDLACFIQFDNVNVYYGMQYKAKYKAPSDHCFVLKHPQIQKESQYIKYLCCDDPWVLHQWVTGIRIAKYGKTLYDNYKAAVHKAGLASHWSSLSNPSVQATAGKSQGNGQVPQNVTSVSSSFSDAWKRGEATKAAQFNESSKPEVIKQPTPTLAKKPPPAPIRASSSAAPVPPLPTKAKPGASRPPPPPQFTSPEASQMEDDFLPPPPPEFLDSPPDFLPPPPPSFNSPSGYAPPPPPPPQMAGTTGAPPPPPPPPSASAPPQLPVKKQPPAPPKRNDNAASMSNGGQPDFMSDLMKALQKKRENTN